MPATSSSQTAHTEGYVVSTEHSFNPVSATNFQNAPAPQRTFNPLSTTAFKSAPAYQHTSMPFSATTSQNAPAPQHTVNPFSATASHNTPAPQWPLPDIPGSYPIMSKDPVTFPSDEYNPWAILHYFDTLVKELVREVYSPEYQIPVESRSRFTGAIRETHWLEVVEAKSRQAAWEPQSCVVPTGVIGPSKDIYVLPDFSHHHHEAPYRSELSIKTQGTSSARERLEYSRKRQKTEPETGWVTSSADPLSSADGFGYRAEADIKDRPMEIPGGYPPTGSIVLKPMGEPTSYWAGPIVSPTQSVQEAEKSDVVDNLLKLWTIVR